MLHFSDLSATEIVSTESLSYSDVQMAGGPRVYTVSLFGLRGAGTVSLAVRTTSGVTDLAGNPLLSGATSEPVSVAIAGLVAGRLLQTSVLAAVLAAAGMAAVSVMSRYSAR